MAGSNKTEVEKARQSFCRILNHPKYSAILRDDNI